MKRKDDAHPILVAVACALLAIYLVLVAHAAVVPPPGAYGKSNSEGPFTPRDPSDPRIERM